MSAGEFAALCRELSAELREPTARVTRPRDWWQRKVAKLLRALEMKSEHWWQLAGMAADELDYLAALAEDEPTTLAGVGKQQRSIMKQLRVVERIVLGGRT